MLRPGNVHSADGWQAVLDPVIARYRGKVSRVCFRADAAFAVPGVYEYLEDKRIKYAIRLPANWVSQVGPKPHDAARCDRRGRFELSEACRKRRNDAASTLRRRPSGESRLNRAVQLSSAARLSASSWY